MGVEVGGGDNKMKGDGEQISKCLLIPVRKLYCLGQKEGPAERSTFGSVFQEALDLFFSFSERL